MNSRVIRDTVMRLESYRPPVLVKRLLKLAPYVPGFIIVLALFFIFAYSQHRGLAILEPRGVVASRERSLLLFGLGLSVIVMVPVFVLLFLFLWRYRETNTKAKYSPELDGSRTAETIWWLIPSALILVLSVVAWNSAHTLDPYRPLASSVAPLRVQVVSLDWKWLFIYPDQGVASVNELHMPINRPVDFTLTSDAPMNSFWIPQLGGQIYTMPGMTTQLHLAASKIGAYHGQSANISGAGFAGMTFMARATSASDFDSWLASAKSSPQTLSQTAYDRLARPSKTNRVATFSSVQPDLFDNVMMKYVAPVSQPTGAMSMSAMDMEATQ